MRHAALLAVLLLTSCVVPAPDRHPPGTPDPNWTVEPPPGRKP